MNADVYFPSQLHWTAQELAEAVPLRLHELFAFDAGRDAARHRQQPITRCRGWRTGYLPALPASPFFRVR